MAEDTSARTGIAFGIRAQDLPSPPADPLEALEAAQDLGASTMQFGDVVALSPDLDPTALARIGRAAADRGITPTATLGPLNPLHSERSPAVLAAGDGELERGVRRILRALSGSGFDAATFTVGAMEDRLRDERPYAAHLAAAEKLLRRLAPVAEESGITLVLKTHEEMTSAEAVDLVQAVGSERLRLGFSPVNLLVLLEDPVAAARRAAPLTHTVFLDDAAVVHDDAGLRRELRPLGRGALRWDEMRRAFADAGASPRFVLDIHRARFGMPFLEPWWLERNPQVAAAELIALLRIAEPPAEGAEHDPGARFLAGVDALRSWPAKAPRGIG